MKLFLEVMMIDLHNKLMRYDSFDQSTQNPLVESRQGRFWHWHRVYVLKDQQSQIYIIKLNIFERIYGNWMGGGIENYFKKIFSDKQIIDVVQKKGLDLLIYNTSSSLRPGDAQSPLKKVYQQIQEEAKQWRGNCEIDLKTGSFLDGTNERKQWWGIFAFTIGSTGLNGLIDRIITIQPGTALDIGCGNSMSAIHLLKKGWRVICLDYSQNALEAMEQRARTVNQQWLETKQLTFICRSIEDYDWPTKVDLVLASSALPYFDPSKIKTLMQNIYQNLKTPGFFIGNFFATKYVGAGIDVQREMGAWFVEDEDSVGYLLAGHGYQVIDCERGGQQNPHSVMFIATKNSDATHPNSNHPISTS
jgi:SAM-dependent methyltransferase